MFQINECSNLVEIKPQFWKKTFSQTPKGMSRKINVAAGEITALRVDMFIFHRRVICVLYYQCFVRVWFCARETKSKYNDRFSVCFTVRERKMQK